MSQQKDQQMQSQDAIASALKPAASAKQPNQQELEQAATEMLAQQPQMMEEGEDMQRLCSIVIVDLNCKEIHLKTVMYEMVYELREFLAEHVYTCFFTNFYFEHAGQRLNEYSELSELDLISNPRIIMKPDKYDERSARSHIKRLVDILEKPPVLTLTTQGPGDEASTAAGSSTPRSRSQSHASQNDEELKSEEQKQQEQQQQQIQEQDEKVQKTYEEFYEVIRAHQGDEVIALTTKEDKSTAQKVLSSVSDLLQGSIYKSDLNKLKHTQCVESIEFSSFNPVPEGRKMNGDIFYLTVRTLENPSYEHCITCSVNGFYKNESTERGSFNPQPTQRSNPCYSYTLAGCLNQLSPLFTRNLQSYLGSILKCEPYFISPIAQPVSHWIVPNDKQIKVSNFEGVGSTIVPLYGYDPRTMRDWNEEFQVVQTFPTTTYFQRVQKDRAQLKVYQDFVDAAILGASAIIEGKLTSLNPNEPVKQHVYVYNSIFFSYAVDTPLQYRDLTSSDQFPSFTQANHDIKGLQQLRTIDVPDLHHLATCLVDFKGHRMICQSIIPGILNNSDLSSLAEYGTVDDKKTIASSEQFHEKMLKVAQGLNIKVNKVIDQTNGQSVEIAGSIEVKGIKGSDRRNYVVDLQGLVPRDANYLGEDFHSCLVRPELIMLLERGQQLDYASEQIKDFSTKLDAERVESEPKPEEGKELTVEQKRAVAIRRQQDNMKKLQEVERLVAEAPKYSFNANVFKKNVQLDMTAEQIEEEEKNVKVLATYITEKAIPNLIQDLKQQEGIPIDSQSLEDFMHKRGVNMRYLGQVLAKVDEFPKKTENMNIHMLQMLGDYKHVKTLLEREIFIRSAKHVINRIIKEEKGETDLHLAQTVSHCLNCLLAPIPFIQSMNTGKLRPVDLAIQNNFQFFPEEQMNTSSRRNSQSSPAPSTKQQKSETSKTAKEVSAFEEPKTQNPEQMTKKQLKKLKQKQNKQAAAAQAQGSELAVKQSQPKADEKSQMSEILFKQNQMLMNDHEEFKIDDLFSQAVLSSGLHRLNAPTFISITPRDIYEQIKEIASVKFGHELPSEQKKLACLQSVNYKTALLRDLCKIVGIQLVCDERKQFLLGNKIKPIVAYLNEALQQEQNSTNQQNKKKKQVQTQVLTEQIVLGEYKYLPFQAQDIKKLFANVKQIKTQNPDVRACLAQAAMAHKENQLDRAFELYSQGINMLLQITGAMNEEVASCITNIAGIQFKYGDFLAAIELQTKAIVLQERVLGVDHPHVGYSYATLSMYYHNCGYFSKGFEYLHRALNILQASIGEYHPEIASLYLKLGLVYQEVENLDATLEAYNQHLDQTHTMFGELHIQTASSYQAIALCHYRRQEFRKALQSQEQAHGVLKAILPAGNQILAASKQQFDMYFKLSVHQEKQKSVVSRGIGENKQKVDPRFLEAISQARRAKDLQTAAENSRIEGEDENATEVKPEVMEQRMEASQAYMRYQSLVSKLKNPNKHDILDVLEYQNIRDKQAEYSARVMQAVAASQKAKEEEDKKVASEEDKKAE